MKIVINKKMRRFKHNKSSVNDKEATVSLRGYAKQRILNEMVDAVKTHAEFSKDYLILVLDHSSAKTFSSCCKFFELHKTGIY